MEYILLETFVIVCDAMNLTKASEILCRTQPTITNRIKQLENQLGFELMIRNKGKRNIMLTGKGEEFLPIARQFVEFYTRINHLQKDSASHLSVSAIDSIGTTIIADIGRLFCEEESALSLSLKTYQTREAYELVRKRELDIAFVSEKIELPNITCEAVFQQKYYVVKPCAQPKDVKEIDPAELDVSHEVYHSWGQDFDAWHKMIWPGQMQPRIRVDSCTLLARFLRDETSWSIVQSGNIAMISRFIPLQRYRLSCETPVRICYMITNAYPDRRSVHLINRFRTALYHYVKTSPDNDYLAIG
ncbi:LysR family transcriptional regulator [Pluralibacter gergoviae]|nr:LysR family transcriptional regulator [Pluralibacter gergoviae]ELC3018164.1 LysR family transcriptional regulator [Pluralibacter gergoviae]ELC3023290.1 LysR family transcriptional regulator [Pluralibacter gergoviae]